MKLGIYSTLRGYSSVTPIFSSPCDLAKRMPEMAADFLELEAQIGRRFREDSVTDIIIASLLKIAGSEATVFTPPEVKTGGDFDIVIHQPATGEGVQYRIQSKRLAVNTKEWSWSSYPELDHPHGSGKQASTLVRSSAREKVPTIPLYAFYNPSFVCGASKGEITGIQLADGHSIAAIVRALVKSKSQGRRPRWKRLEYLKHLLFPLSTILCPPDNGTPDKTKIIRPEISRRATLLAIEERRILTTDKDYLIPRIHFKGRKTKILPAPDQISKQIDDTPSKFRGHKIYDTTDIIARAIDRKPDEPAIQSAKIKRPKLILLSR